MLQQLISHSPDLKKLRDEGYELERKGGYLCIHHIPYVTSSRKVAYGTLISDLSITGNKAGPPSTHAIYFMGEVPCHKDGTRMDEIINSSPNQPIEGLIGNHYFSSKPASGKYDNNYDKFTRYINLLSTPARSIDPLATALTFKPYIDDEESVFHYFDSNASRANIDQLMDVFKSQCIAIIGLGGSGSYILDFVSKTPVAEIHLFDADVFSQHNAFRCPGAASIDILEKSPLKVDYFANIYSKMHKGIQVHPEFITQHNIQKLSGFNYVFICIDKNSLRSDIINGLSLLEINFIDVGLGVNLQDGKLIGIIRTTTGIQQSYDHLIKRISTEDTDNNEYVTNIQIADLNAMNACKAVEKWKKLSGFYQDDIGELHSTYTLSASMLLNGDFTA
ncbi:ThiF family adenylyltransferase [Rhodocytophaga aerolata]|uniref:ThiF family adenylyltransferase n=1 Tax=Rhodocytophaga aerolata TaxID=455078 RepID=A0ABT8RDU1_9BACT|nr:ThiF family adenylyltransferase [Rhodocytophaga aerolata]MDO1449514.1 ThiF family adenylyltransferase [Rhodocytophaga aerolata]